MPLTLPAASGGMTPGIKKLNLNAMSAPTAAIATGEKVIGEGATMQSPRATTEAVLGVRGVATMRARPLIILDARELGMSSLQTSWQPRGPLLAVASQNERGLLVQVYDTATRAKIRSHQFGKGAATSCEWDCSGTTLAVTQEGVGIHLWDAGGPSARVRGGTGPPSPRPLALAHSSTSNATCATWSRCTAQLAIGTAAGKVGVLSFPFLFLIPSAMGPCAGTTRAIAGRQGRAGVKSAAGSTQGDFVLEAGGHTTLAPPSFSVAVPSSSRLAPPFLAFFTPSPPPLPFIYPLLLHLSPPAPSTFPATLATDASLYSTF